MSTIELQKTIKDYVVQSMMYSGIQEVFPETIQVDNYKWLVPVELNNRQFFVEVSLTAKKADFTYEDANTTQAKFIEKYEKAMKREADKSKKVIKENSKTPRNSSSNLDSSSVIDGTYGTYDDF